MMHFLGIDWADDKHDLCLLAEDGRIISQFTIRHDWSGFQHLQQILESFPDTKIILERSNGLLVDWLVKGGWEIYILNPHILAHRRPRRSKDDQRDAYLLAHLLRMGDPECRPLIIQSPIVEHLKQLMVTYDSLLQQQRRFGNQMTFYLKQYYPAAESLFSHVFNLISLAFLEQFPTPQEAQALSLEEFRTFLVTQSYRHMPRVPKLYQHLQNPAPQARVQAGYVEHVRCLIPLLRTVFIQKTRLSKEIEQVFLSHPEAALWQSLPGAGLMTSARLLTWIGDNRDRFPTPDILQATAGTAPITRSSGKQKTVEFRWACSHPLRSTADDLARLSVRESGWAAAYYQQQRDRGHEKPRAYRALANRWMSIIWKLWQTGQHYDEMVHVMNRSHQGKQTAQSA
jgi:transposase